MKAYKGFNRDMTCRGFQYAEGEMYHTDTAELCESGFHACKYPLDVLAYYPPSSSVYHEVELDEVSDECEDDSKICAKTIRVGARMDIASLVKASVEYIISKCNKSCRKHVTVDQGVAPAEDDQSVAYVTGNYSAASVTGYQSVAFAAGSQSTASATDDYSAASAIGDYSVASATGDQSAALATGDYSAASTIGCQSVTSVTGYQSVATTTGERSVAFTEGDYSAALVTGYRSMASADNPTAIAVAWGLKGRAKGVLGAYIVCAEWKEGKLICAKMAQVDGVTIKADTYYVLVDGNFVEMGE